MVLVSQAVDVTLIFGPTQKAQTGVQIASFDRNTIFYAVIIILKILQ